MDVLRGGRTKTPFFEEKRCEVDKGVKPEGGVSQLFPPCVNSGVYFAGTECPDLDFSIAVQEKVSINISDPVKAVTDVCLNFSFE